MAIFYDFSGGMESAAMLAIEAVRIRTTGAIIRFADTGKQFPEAYDSIWQISRKLQIPVVFVPRRITFDEFLFERGGLIRKGTIDCSKRMKRGNLARHMKSFPAPYEVNLGYNADEDQRMREFIELNERPWLHWRFPLVDAGIDRDASWDICRRFGFSILVSMYEKMGRMDCFWCGNQKPSQALRVVDNYPMLAREWMNAERRKGHSFMPVYLKVLVENRDRQGVLFPQSEMQCACFGGSEPIAELDDISA